MRQYFWPHTVCTDDNVPGTRERARGLIYYIQTNMYNLENIFFFCFIYIIHYLQVGCLDVSRCCSRTDIVLGSAL